jgi:hypothetical protein
MVEEHDTARAFYRAEVRVEEGSSIRYARTGRGRSHFTLWGSAEELLNERKAEGIALTEDQIDFLDRVDGAQERLQGGVEDATIALGEQALAYSVTATFNEIHNRINTGGSPDPGVQFALGGMLPTAALGRMTPHGTTLVGEFGPELIGNGTVWPAPATHGHLKRQGGGGGRVINNYGSINVYANDPRECWDRMQSFGLSGR